MLAILNHITFPALVDLPTLYFVGNIGTVGTNGITNDTSGTICKTLYGFRLPMVPFLPILRTPNARIIYLPMVLLLPLLRTTDETTNHTVNTTLQTKIQDTNSLLPIRAPNMSRIIKQ